MRVPMSEFTSRTLLDEEQEVFFRQTPLCMGLSSALPEPNTYWSDNSTGIPILMVRDGEGHFRAYANICRHRASQVVPEGRGRKVNFTCPFHAWTYSNKGDLLAVNQSNQFGDVSSLGLCLIELPSAELYGTLWVRPTEGDPLDEKECLGGLEDDFTHWGFADHPYRDAQVIDARMNWKLGVDSYGELYHLTVLHAQTVGNLVVGNLQTFDRFGNNLRMVIANQNFNLVRMLMPNRSTWLYRQVTSTMYYLYPNVIMTVDGFGVDFTRIFPSQGSPSHSRTIHTWYINPSMQKHFDNDSKASDERLQRFREAVENEDYVMGAQIQVNAARGTMREIVLGRNEISLQHFHNSRRAREGRELLPVE